MMNRRTLILAALCLFAGSSTFAQSTAADLFKAGKFAEADAAISEKAQDLESLKIKGQIALFANRLDDAIKDLTKASKLDAADKNILSLLGQAYYRKDDMKKAAEYYQAAGRDPIARKLASFGGKKAYSIAGEEARIKFVKLDPLPIVSAKVNGEELTFLIDTGGPELVIDTETAAKMSLTLFGEETGTFAAGRRAGVNHSTVNTVELGSIKVENVPVNILPTQRYAAVLGVPKIDGILGTVLLSRFLATLDYPTGELVLRKRSKSASAKLPRTAEVPFVMAGDHYLLAWGAVNGSSELMFIDTGLAGMGFAAPDSTIKNANIMVGGKPFEGTGGGGTVRAVPFVTDTVSVGSVTESKIVGVAGVFPPSLENSMGFRIGGLVSHSFFKPYSVTFDFDSMKMIFNKPAK